MAVSVEHVGYMSSLLLCLSVGLATLPWVHRNMEVRRRRVYAHYLECSRGKFDRWYFMEFYGAANVRIEARTEYKLG